MPEYTIDSIFDPSSPYYTGSVFQPSPPGSQNSFLDKINPANIGSGEIGEDVQLRAEAALRSGQTDYDTGIGFWLGANDGTPKFSIGNSSGRKITWDGSNLSINGFVETNIGSFGGDGTDGALAITSGTTTLSLASAQVVTKNYTSISVTGTGSFAFSSPNTSGTIIILKSQGAVTLTSSSASINASGMGAAGGAALTDGTDPLGLLFTTTTPKGLTSAGGSGVGGVAGVQYEGNFYTISEYQLIRKALFLVPGAGGAGGATNGSSTGGAGGNGGGALYVESAGALNFTGSVNVSGLVGSVSTNAGATDEAGGGGGGGSAGTCVILYNTLTSAAGTIIATGGAGGDSGTSAGNVGASGGGGGAGSLSAAGGAGGNTGSGGSAAAGLGAGGGGAAGRNGAGAGLVGGAAGGSIGGLVAQNKYFG